MGKILGFPRSQRLPIRSVQGALGALALAAATWATGCGGASERDADDGDVARSGTGAAPATGGAGGSGATSSGGVTRSGGATNTGGTGNPCDRVPKTTTTCFPYEPTTGVGGESSGGAGGEAGTDDGTSVTPTLEQCRALGSEP